MASRDYTEIKVLPEDQRTFDICVATLLNHHKRSPSLGLSWISQFVPDNMRDDVMAEVERTIADMDCSSGDTMEPGC